VFDRDPTFTSKLWKGLFKGFGTNLNFSTTYHLESDEKTERVNQVIEDMLRMYVMDKPSKWEDYLHLVEFSYNNGVSDKKCTGIFGVSPQVLFSMPISKYVWPVFCLQISMDQAPIDYVYLRVFSSCLQCLYSKTWLVLFRHLSIYLFRCLIINFC
jgi:hypothetical protein